MYGRVARKQAERFLGEGLYAVAATDLHRPEEARRWLEAGLRALEKRAGADGLRRLCSENPRRILRGEETRVRGRLVQALVGVAVSAVALWLTLRGKDLRDVWLAMREADYRYLVLYLPFWAVIHLSRTWRWGSCWSRSPRSRSEAQRGLVAWAGWR